MHRLGFHNSRMGPSHKCYRGAQQIDVSDGEQYGVGSLHYEAERAARDVFGLFVLEIRCFIGDYPFLFPPASRLPVHHGL